MTCESLVELGIRRFWWWSFCLLEGQGDRDADQIEGLALVTGGFGKHGYGGVGAGVAELVAGQGDQVVEQATEAAVGVAEGIALVGGLGLGALGALSGCVRVGVRR